MKMELLTEYCEWRHSLTRHHLYRIRHIVRRRCRRLSPHPHYLRQAGSVFCTSSDAFRQVQVLCMNAVSPCRWWRRRRPGRGIDGVTGRHWTESCVRPDPVNRLPRPPSPSRPLSPSVVPCPARRPPPQSTDRHVLGYRTASPQWFAELYHKPPSLRPALHRLLVI